MKLTTLVVAASFLLGTSTPGVRGENPWEGDKPTKDEIKDKMPAVAEDKMPAVAEENVQQATSAAEEALQLQNLAWTDVKGERRLLNVPDCHLFTTSTNQDQNLVSCVTTKEDISTTCQDDTYDVLLSASNNNGQSHLFIIAMMKEVAENNGATNNNCPPTMLLDHTHEGEKKIVVLLDDMDYVKDLPRHPLGEASLRDILMADESVEATDPSNYDYFYNSCAHYAQRIWRSLGFKETKELGDFIIDNVINDVHGMEIAKKSKGIRSLRALATFAIGGKGEYENYVKDVVYSQLNLV